LQKEKGGKIGQLAGGWGLLRRGACLPDVRQGVEGMSDLNIKRRGIGELGNARIRGGDRRGVARKHHQNPKKRWFLGGGEA